MAKKLVYACKEEDEPLKERSAITPKTWRTTQDGNKKTK